MWQEWPGGGVGAPAFCRQYVIGRRYVPEGLKRHIEVRSHVYGKSFSRGGAPERFGWTIWFPREKHELSRWVAAVMDSIAWKVVGSGKEFPTRRATRVNDLQLRFAGRYYRKRCLSNDPL